MSKTTDWFPSSIRPVRVGWYEVGHDKPMHWNSRHKLTGRPFRYWNGKQWHIASPAEAWARGLGPSIFGSCPSHQWRGLTKESR
jgi:hypothetical protein